MNKQIQIAVVGAGYWGPNLIRNFNSIDACCVAWVCDAKLGRRQWVNQTYPGIPATENMEDILKDPNVDAVVIATPVSTHKQIAVAALEAGKHVWVEKPLADSTLAAGEILRAAEARGLLVATDHLFVFNPAISRARELISEGVIGHIYYAESGRVNLGPPASEVNVIWDLATHDLAISYCLWGRKPSQVVALGRRYKHPELIDMAFVQLHFDDGSTAVHHVSWLCPEKVRRYFIAGENGNLLFDDMQPEHKLKMIDQGVDSRIGLKDDDVKELYYRPGEIRFTEIQPVEPLRAACEDFLDAVAKVRKPLVDGDAGLAVVEILEAAERSIAEGGKAIRLLS